MWARGLCLCLEMNVVHACREYVLKMVTEVGGMKCLLLDDETVRKDPSPLCAVAVSCVRSSVVLIIACSLLDVYCEHGVYPV